MLDIEPRFLLGKPLAALVDAADSRMLREAIERAADEAVSIELELRFKPPQQRAAAGTRSRRVDRRAGDRDPLDRARRAGGATTPRAAAHERTRRSAPDVALASAELERANRDKAELLERERRLRDAARGRATPRRTASSPCSRTISARRSTPSSAGRSSSVVRRSIMRARDRALATIERNARRSSASSRSSSTSRASARAALQLERSPVDLRELVRRAVDASPTTARERSVEVASRSARRRSSSPAIDAASSRCLEPPLERAQVHAAGRQGHAQLDHDGPTARIDVADTGQGIAPELLPRVFDPFHDASADYGDGVRGARARALHRATGRHDARRRGRRREPGVRPRGPLRRDASARRREQGEAAGRAATTGAVTRPRRAASPRRSSTA